MRSSRAHARRGQYSVIMGISLLTLLGFGAVSIDLSMISVVRSQADALAYASAHSAIVAYARGRTLDAAEGFAAQVAAANTEGARFDLDEIRWGTVDRRTGELVTSFDVTAAEAHVSRDGAARLAMHFGTLFGVTDVAVSGAAVSDQIPTPFDGDGCDTFLVQNGNDGAILGTAADRHNVLSYDITSPVGGWFDLYKAEVAESGSAQLNESSYFRVINGANADGFPEAGNCGDDYVVRDYDNDNTLPERVYLGTFFLEPGHNVLEMRHYCGIVDQCPQFEHEAVPCGGVNSVHYFAGNALCAEAR